MTDGIVLINPEDLLWLLIFVLVFLFVTVGVVIFLYVAHQRIERQRHLRAIAPLFHERPHVTIESTICYFSFLSPFPSHTHGGLPVDILTDPDIPHIAWESIQVGERIGKGASGLVTSGMWDMYGYAPPLPLGVVWQGLMGRYAVAGMETR